MDIRSVLARLCHLAVPVAVLFSVGCVQHRQPNLDDTRTAAPNPGSGYVPEEVLNGQKDYYVDQDGALHQVTRRLVRSEGGLYSIEDDHDGEGRTLEKDREGRLFYKDDSGAIHYVREVQPGATERKAAPRKAATARPAPAGKHESCESQWRSCVSACNAISPREAYDRPGCLNDCEYIRRHCSGR